MPRDREHDVRGPVPGLDMRVRWPGDGRLAGDGESDRVQVAGDLRLSRSPAAARRRSPGSAADRHAGRADRGRTTSHQSDLGAAPGCDHNDVRSRSISDSAAGSRLGPPAAIALRVFAVADRIGQTCTSIASESRSNGTRFQYGRQVNSRDVNAPFSEPPAPSIAAEIAVGSGRNSVPLNSMCSR